MTADIFHNCAEFSSRRIYLLGLDEQKLDNWSYKHKCNNIIIEDSCFPFNIGKIIVHILKKERTYRSKYINEGLFFVLFCFDKFLCTFAEKAYNGGEIILEFVHIFPRPPAAVFSALITGLMTMQNFRPTRSIL